jgi:hypothetical protein
MSRPAWPDMPVKRIFPCLFASARGCSSSSRPDRLLDFLGGRRPLPEVVGRQGLAGPVVDRVRVASLVVGGRDGLRRDRALVAPPDERAADRPLRDTAAVAVGRVEVRDARVDGVRQVSSPSARRKEPNAMSGTSRPVPPSVRRARTVRARPRPAGVAVARPMPAARCRRESPPIDAPAPPPSVAMAPRLRRAGTSIRRGET